MKFLFSASSFALLLYLSQTTNAEVQKLFRNDTISLGASPSLIFSKRTTCSGTCAECYGTGSVYCGTNDACYNPTIGDSCCAQYSYSCPDGYYCAPGGLDMQCCANTISTDECTASINGGGTSGGGGLSAGARAGIGIGVTLLVLIIAGLALWLFLRRPRPRHNVAPIPPAWPMSELPSGNGGPGVVQAGYNGTQGSYGGAQGGYDSTQGGYNGTQVIYNGTQGGYDGGYGNTDTKSRQFSGGPPVAEVYTPVDRPQNVEYNNFVPSHAELPESPQSVHMADPAMPHAYPPSTEQDRAGAAEMYGGYTGQHY